jgi:hypothetical protein
MIALRSVRLRPDDRGSLVTLWQRMHWLSATTSLGRFALPYLTLDPNMSIAGFKALVSLSK